MLRRFALISAIALTACEQPMAQDRLGAMSARDLCETYSNYRYSGADHLTEQFLTELSRRGAATPDQIAAIRRRDIERGMPETIAICSWGPLTATNADSSGRKQLVMLPRGTYVYTEGGRVRDWQQSY